MTQFAVVAHSIDAGGFWTEVPGLPGCASQGPSLDDAVENTRAAIRQWLAYLRAQGEPAPASGDLLLVLDPDAQ